jgi:DNA-binding NarL/FixJ family response regulator
MTGEVARKVIHSFRRTPTQSSDVEQLTPREVEVLELLAKGHLSKEIADRLTVGVETVNSHLKHIYEKLHVRSRTEAVIKYMK